jgi:hypothetical protein
MALSIPSAPALSQSVTAWPQKRSLRVVPLTTKVVRYEAGQGADSHVTIQWCKGIPAKDTITRTISSLSKPMCLTREEVRGQKVEHEIMLPPGSSALKLIPGGIFASQELLTSGTFLYQGWETRQSFTLHGQGHLAPKQEIVISAKAGGGLQEQDAMDALQILMDPGRCSAPPKRSACSEMCWSTSQDSMGFNIGGSFFYMGLAETQQFSFSSDKYRYLYVYMFDQVFGSATAELPSDEADLLSHVESLSEDALFLLETKYGRRVYVIMESEAALENYSNGIPGGLEWLIISAKLQQPSFARRANGHIRIRLQTQDGTWLNVDDYAQLQATIDDYFCTSCQENPLSPLSYKVSDLDGTPVCLLTTAFLDSQHCLTSPKARVQLREIKLSETDPMDPIISEEIYGILNLHLFHPLNHQLIGNGHSLDASPPLKHTLAGSITIASQDTPLKLTRGKTTSFDSQDSGKYIDVDISSLDMFFQVEPVLQEKALIPGNHSFSSNTDSKKKLRQMLMEGSMRTTIQCEHAKCRLELTLEITPF